MALPPMMFATTGKNHWPRGGKRYQPYQKRRLFGGRSPLVIANGMVPRPAVPRLPPGAWIPAGDVPAKFDTIYERD